MGYKFVDTNIFIEVFARSGEKSDKSKVLISESNNLYTSSLVISEIEWVLRYAYKKKRAEIVVYLKRILSTGIKIENQKLIIKALTCYQKNNVDWTDCLNMFLAQENNIKEVYSYDRGISKFGWVTRLEP